MFVEMSLNVTFFSEVVLVLFQLLLLLLIFSFEKGLTCFFFVQTILQLHILVFYLVEGIF